MKLFRFRGGIHPEVNKKRTENAAIATLPLPARLYIPLQQHIGKVAEPEVRVGQKVLKGELLAHSQGAISAPVHAPTSGEIVAIRDFTAPHVSGLPVRTIILEPDGDERWGERHSTTDPFSMEPQQIAARVGAAGIVGMGGATFPSAVKLSISERSTIHTLIINGAECEPYLTCDDRLMRERAAAVIDGIRIMRHALQAERAIIVIEDNKPEAIAAMSAASAEFKELSVAVAPTRYPMGSEKQMIQAATGREVPAQGLASDIGLLVHNVATAYAVHCALRDATPLISRIVTVSGDAVTTPQNMEVPVGVLISDLLDHCGLIGEPQRLLMGGPMMGQALPHARVPVVKGMNGVIALTAQEMQTNQPSPCIRCSRCVSACPIGLLPLEMASRIRNGNFSGALDYGLIDCIGCGACAYVCPSRIPLTHHFNFAKGELGRRQRAEQKMNETRKLAETRQARLDAEKRAKAEAAARRKAEREAKKAAEAEKAAQQALAQPSPEEATVAVEANR